MEQEEQLLISQNQVSDELAHQINIQTKINTVDGHIRPLPAQHFNKRDKLGVVIIILVYALMTKIYLFTMVHTLGDKIQNAEAGAIVNGFFLTFFVVLSVVSHFRCMTTNPGFLPKNYDSLSEKNLSNRFLKLIQERESIHQSALIRKLQRQGMEETEAQQVALRQSSLDIQEKLPNNGKANRTSSNLSSALSSSLKVRRNTYVDKIIEKKCYKCNSVKPPNAHHCANCNHCVAYMDHHCPWINNCVGLYTQKLFVLFNFYTLISIIYILSLLITDGFYKLRNHSTIYGANQKIKMQLSDFLQVLCIFECITFGLFIIVVFFDQISIILNRLTVIDKVRLYDNRLTQYKKRGCKNYKVTFGGPFSIWWFIPTPIEGTFDVEELFN
ncbi:palmitoyltransferase zdhhc3 [Stylonychia lemnae]|uniref:Palmitoyltransferase n=1 Tax=Stylonychia lemnae TaxID=5949 RepID=A0A078BDY8_STYLE|nr:palmitoyltransferase zdhhc3 [Stylonychia lemnae]|eukprot:CDW91793.1 palmitoyltransferase zdhhc3 [Stylonychia lemnae]